MEIVGKCGIVAAGSKHDRLDDQHHSWLEPAD